MMSSISENIQILIREGYLKEALDEYLRHATSIGDDKLKNHLIHLHGQPADLESKFNLGVISENKYLTVKNRIRLGILEHQATSSTEDEEKTKKREEIRQQIVGAVCLTIAITSSHYLNLNIVFQYCLVGLMAFMSVTVFYSINLTVEQFKQLLVPSITLIALIGILLMLFF